MRGAVTYLGKKTITLLDAKTFPHYHQPNQSQSSPCDGESDGSDTDGLCAHLMARIYSDEPIEQILADLYYAIEIERENRKENTMNHQRISTNISPSQQSSPPLMEGFCLSLPNWN